MGDRGQCFVLFKHVRPTTISETAPSDSSTLAPKHPQYLATAAGMFWHLTLARLNQARLKLDTVPFEGTFGEACDAKDKPTFVQASSVDAPSSHSHLSSCCAAEDDSCAAADYSGEASGVARLVPG